MMHDHEKSDPAIVAVKPTNKAGQPAGQRKPTLDKESPIQAVCPNWARTDLCGGREVTRVPTAKVSGAQSEWRE